MFLEIAEAIKKYAPSAWVINYTNPMTLCIKTLYHAFPQIKAFGCCHEVFGTQKLLAAIAKEELGVEEISREEIAVNVLGINHFTWFDYASYKGIDLFPVYRAYIEKNFEEGFNEPDNNWMNSTFACAHRVKMDLFLKYGLIAAAGDRHLAEFMPGDMYLKDPATVEGWKFGLTTVKWRKEDLQRRLLRSKRLVSGEEEIVLKPTGEEGIELIKALCGLRRMVSNVNIPNTAGQIENLPRTAVVETNALFERDAIRPLVAGTVPKQIKELLMPHIENHERVLNAVLTNDRSLVKEAFLADPLVKGRVSEEEAKVLADDMLDATL